MTIVQPAPTEHDCQGGLRPSVPSISLDFDPVMMKMIMTIAMMISSMTMMTEAIFTIHLARLCEQSEGEVEA